MSNFDLNFTESEYPKATADDIIKVVEKSNLEKCCSPTRGHCVYVARALADLFDVDSAYVSVMPGQKYNRPAHMAVMKDGVLIDGTRRNFGGTYEGARNIGRRQRPDGQG